MASAVLVFYLTCLLFGNMARTTAPKFSSSDPQDHGFLSAKTSEKLTLQCFYEGDVAARQYWYKQSLGQKPRLISTFYMYEANSTFYGEFNNNPRFTLDAEDGKNHLTITDLRMSDSATYYCISSYLYMIKFSESFTVSVMDSSSNIQALIRQSSSETIRPEGSVTLNCTVHTGTCDGEHSVYWFKNSQEPHPGLIYTHGGRNDQCERKPNTQTHTCVYNLPVKSLNQSHAGTYYCAVASCGHILFGDGTKLDVSHEVDFVGYFWSGVLALSSILNVLLAFLLCMMNKRNTCKSPESQAGLPSPLRADAKAYQHAENIYFAALSVNLTNRSRKQRVPTWSECVYNSVKQ